jgi:GNAT superfamily N-acetyltransferase
VPCGLTGDGLPIGLQLVGPMFGDALVLRAARAFESTCPVPRPDLARHRLTMDLTWTLDHQPADADLARITDAVVAHGRALADSDAQAIACFVRQGGRIVAGACGRTELQRLYVHHLWVDEPLRRRGLATELLQRLEAAARDRGCFDAALETLSDEGCGLVRPPRLAQRGHGATLGGALQPPRAGEAAGGDGGAGAVRMTLERPDKPDVWALIDALDAYQKPLYPPRATTASTSPRCCSPRCCSR